MLGYQEERSLAGWPGTPPASQFLGHFLGVLVGSNFLLQEQYLILCHGSYCTAEGFGMSKVARFFKLLFWLLPFSALKDIHGLGGPCLDARGRKVQSMGDECLQMVPRRSTPALQ